MSVCTPPFNNMACKSLAADHLSLAAGVTPTSSAAFKTPLGSAYVSVPSTPSLFLTPVDHTPVSSAAGRGVPTLSLNDETVSGRQAADAAALHRPTKKRRFIVTKAEDKEMLLPPE